MFLSLHHINPEYMEKIKTHFCVTKYESMKNFFRCSFPVSKNECCSYVGSLSDVDNHFPMHTGAYRFYCWNCNQLYHEESASNTHSKNGCPRSKSEFLAHDEKLVLFHRRAKNLFIKQIDREDYKRIHEGNLQLMKSVVDKEVPTYDVSAPFNSAKRATLPDYPTRHPDHRSSRQVFDAVATPRYEDQQNLDVRSHPAGPVRSEERQDPRSQPTEPCRTARSDTTVHQQNSDARSKPAAPVQTSKPESAPVSDPRQTQTSDPRRKSMSTPQQCRPALERGRDLEREYSSDQRLQTSTRQQDAVPTVPAPRPDSERPAPRPSAGPDRTPRSELGHVQESVDNHQSGLSTPQNEASPRTCPPRRGRDLGLDRAAHQRFQETTRQQDPAPSVPAPKRNSERLAPHCQQNSVGADRTPRPELGHGQKSDMSPPLNDAPPRTCLPRRGRDLELEYSADQRLQMSTRQQDSAPIVPAPRPNSVRPAPQHPQNTAPHPPVGSDRISRLEVGHGQEFVYNQQFGIPTPHNQNDAPLGICPPAPRREWGSELENGAHQRFHDSDPRQDNATTPEQEAPPRVCPPAPRREWGSELEHGAHQRFQDINPRQNSDPPRPDQFESHGHNPQDSWHNNGRPGFPTPAHSPNAPLLGPPVNEVPHHHNGLQNRGPGHPLHPVWGVFGFQGNGDSRQPNGYQSGPPPFVYQQPANNQWNNNYPPNDFRRDYWDHQGPPHHSRSRHPSPERGQNWNMSQSRSRPQSRGPITPQHRSKSRHSRRPSPVAVAQQENSIQTAPEETNQSSLNDLSDVRRIMSDWVSRKSSDAVEDRNTMILNHQQSAHPLLGSPIFLPAIKPKPLRELSEKDIELKADLELKARLAEMHVERYFPPPPPPPPPVTDHEHVGARQTESITDSSAPVQEDDPPATDPAINRIHQGIQALRFTLTGQCSNRPPTSKPSPVSPPRPASVLLALKDKNVKNVDQLLRERPLQQTERVSRKRISNHDDDSNVQTQFAPDCSKPTVNARNGREEREDRAPIQKRWRPAFSETDYSPSSPTYSETSSSSLENSQRPPPTRSSGSPQHHQPASVSLKIQTPTQFKTSPTKIRYSRSSTDSDGSGGSIGVSVPINHTTPIKSRGTSLALNSHGSNRNASLLTSPEQYRTRKVAHPEK